MINVRTLTMNLAFAAALVGCGGSSTVEDTPGGGLSDTPPTNTNRAVSVSGKIDAFGSVVVGGVHYNTDDAVIYINGELADEESLDVGQIVEIIGEIDEETGEAIAEIIEYFTEVQGPISSFNPETGEITVLGQTIILDDDLVDLEGFDLQDLTEGLNIEVSGHRDDMGNVVATFIEIVQNDEVIISGEITDVDLENLTVEINGQEISIADLIDLPLEDIVIGEDIFVIGDLDGDLIIPDLDFDIDDFFNDFIDSIDTTSSIEIEGVVDEIINETDFSIVGLTFRITDATEFEDGSIEDLDEGRLVEVSGEFEGDIVLVDTISFDPESDISLEGFVESIDVESNSFTMFGLTFTATEDTVWEDDSSAEVREFSIADLMVGDFVVVDAVTLFDNDISFELKSVVREDLDFEIDPGSNIEFSDVLVVGEVIAFENNMLSLSNDISLLVDDMTILPEGIEDASSLVGMLVEIDGRYDEGILVAEEIAIAVGCEFDQTNSVESGGVSITSDLSVELFCDIDIPNIDIPDVEVPDTANPDATEPVL